MAITIKNSEEFERLLDELMSEFAYARAHFKLYCDLKDSVMTYEYEMMQSATFWSLTLKAHLDAALISLCRLYDKDQKSLNLHKLLEIIKANTSLFDIGRFKERLKDNPSVESLSQRARKPDIDQLKKDLEFASGNNPRVKILRDWRNGIIAHKDARDLIEGRDVTIDSPLSQEDISLLLNEGAAVLNRYSGLFRARTNADQMLGQPDYKFVLAYIKSYIKRQDKEMDIKMAGDSKQ